MLDTDYLKTHYCYNPSFNYLYVYVRKPNTWTLEYKSIKNKKENNILKVRHKKYKKLSDDFEFILIDLNFLEKELKNQLFDLSYITKSEEHFFNYLVNSPEEILFNIINLEEINPNFISNVI